MTISWCLKMSASEQSIVDSMNRHCLCVGTDVSTLQAGLDARVRDQETAASIVASHSHLFSALPVFVSREHAKRIAEIVSAVEVVANLPAYQDAARQHAPPIAHIASSARGVFLCHDFHLSPDGPKLIEINTNAGGALLNVEMIRSQQACCPEVSDYLRTQAGPAELEERFVEMFLQEWRTARGNAPLRSIAIVDEDPQGQYLYPEFVLFKQLFESHGIRAIIASPEQLNYDGRVVSVEGAGIDLIYNRLTDFYLSSPTHAPLAHAYRDDAVVVTPHPVAHVTYANKHNLELLSDETFLRSTNLPPNTIDTLLHGVPRTVAVDATDTERWWNERKQWFFKPATGFGSRGSYRGDKLTRKVFSEIVQSDYVAQELVLPSERWVTSNASNSLRFDVRAYVYGNEVQLLAARLYRGQTTNFRTEGGGFAPVYVL
jgi:hypothetical protein